MKEKFRDEVHLNKANLELLKTINEIIEDYREQGYKLTLRQLYYQLVSRDIIPNKTEEYAKLSIILVKGRMAGIVDWDAIEDRIRKPYIPYYSEDLEDALDDTIQQYRLDRMRNQPIYIECWVEKDALSGVLKRVTEEFHVRLMVNRGYSSASAMYDAYKRIRRANAYGQDAVILYLGDHDPSGMDMIRDISDRLNEFGVSPTVSAIALTDEQIEKYNPPPNPAKVTDPRAKDYIARYGPTSWEVDALKPEVLHNLVTDAIGSIIDPNAFDDMKDLEQKDIGRLRKLIDLLEDSPEDDNKDDLDD
jgi:hypothetical protein